jgi:hypothetical protein
MRVLSLLLFSSSLVWAQEVKPVVVVLHERPVQAYIDRPGDVYIQFSDNRIEKFNAQGKSLGSQRIANLVLFEPRDGARMFSFTSSAEYGFYLFGNPQLTVMPSEFALKPALACTLGDQQLWLFDQEDHSLKLISLAEQRVITEVAPPRLLQPRQMRAYQDFLFYLTDENLLILNRLGHIIKIFTQPISWFNFLGEELYFQSGSTIVFYDLMEGTVHTTPVKENSLCTLQSDQYRFTLFTDRLEIEPFP